MNEPTRDPLPTIDCVPREVASTADGENLEQTNSDLVSDSPALAPEIPGYRVTSEIARGGMGRIYAAIDLTFDRQIAIKTLLRGASSERFLTESKITARLPHPGIPPVHALGTLADGKPYLVMKLIHGQTLAALLKSRSSPAENLPRLVQIFEQIAQAVGFAHRRGVIHRDLKPLNVMVGEFGEVQVMDWGLAKEMASGEVDSSPSPASREASVTQDGAVIGTPGYMAPEQARGEMVDRRADVFALGSMLAAILTGQPAFTGTTARETIDKAASADLAEVRERLDRCGADADLVALARHCLAPQAAERPADAQAVAAEVTAYRASVEARLRQAETERAAAVVREGEQRKRRQVILASAAVVVGVLALATTVSLWQAWVANTARVATAAQLVKTQAAEAKTASQLKKTQEAEGKTAAQLKKTEEARADAVEKLGFAKKSNAILGSVFTALDPKANYANVSDLRDALKANLGKAVVELEGSAIGDPLEVAAMQDRLGTSLLGLGEPAQAIVLLEKARNTRKLKLGATHFDTLVSMNNLAEAYKGDGKLDLAMPLHEATYELRKATLGTDHRETLASMNNLAAAYLDAGKLDKALPLFEQTLQLRQATLGADHPDTLFSMNGLAQGYKAAGNLDKAVPLYEQSLELRKATLGDDHPDTLATLAGLAVCYKTAGNLDLALPLLEQTLELSKIKLGGDHPDTFARMNNLAAGYQAAGKLDKALPLYEQAYERLRAKLGDDHPDTLISIHNLTLGYKTAGQLEKALPLYEQTYQRMKAKLGADHPDTLLSMNNLAVGYKTAGKLDQALPLLEQTFQLMKAKLGADHPHTLKSMGNLATGYQAARKLDLALPLLEETHELMKVKLGADHPDTLTSMNNLARGYRAARKLDLALPLLKQTLQLRKAKLGAGHPDTLGTMSDLADGYQDAGRTDLALPLLKETLELTKAQFGADHLNTLTSMNSLAMAYWTARRPKESVPLFESLLPLVEKKLGRDHLKTLLAMANLGVNYKDIGRAAEAVPLLEEVYRASARYPNLRGAGDQLLDAYVKAGKGTEAAQLAGELLSGARKQFASDNSQLAAALAKYSVTLLELKQFMEAEPLLRECLAIREKKEPDAWTTFNTESLLGGALLDQKKYADAEPLLLKGYEGLKARESKIPPQAPTVIPEALDRLIEHYSQWGKPDEVKKYQELRAKYSLPEKPSLENRRDQRG